MSKRKLSTELIGSPSLDWNLCLYCQRQTKDDLVCPSSVQRKYHDANATYTKTATNIERFEPLDQSPIALQFQEIDKKLLTELFIKNDAKFHKSCTSQFSDMKIERAEKIKGK